MVGLKGHMSARAGYLKELTHSEQPSTLLPIYPFNLTYSLTKWERDQESHPMSPIQLLRMGAVHSYVARDIEFVRDMALKN